MKYFLLGLLLAISTAASSQHQAMCTPKFSPKGGALEETIKLIQSAKKSIHIMTYQLTSTPIGNALIAAKNSGVSVIVIADRSQLTQRGSMLKALEVGGVTIRIDKKHKIQHNKVIIVDAYLVQTGSFNLSRNAELYNSENLLICNSPELASSYLENWHEHWNHSVSFDSKVRP